MLSRLIIWAILSHIVFNFSVHADDFNFIGQHEFGMRVRFQEVKDPWLGDAQASTARIKLTSVFELNSLLNPKVSDEGNWQLLIEPNFVYAFNDGNYNSVTVKKFTSAIPAQYCQKRR